MKETLSLLDILTNAALVGSLLTLVVAVSPALAPYQDKVVTVIDLFIAVVIAGIALEDAAVKFKSGGDRNG